MVPDPTSMGIQLITFEVGFAGVQILTIQLIGIST